MFGEKPTGVQDLRPFRLRFTIRQLMIVVGALGLILGLVVAAMEGDDAATMALLLAWLSAPAWGALVVALLKPLASRRLFQAACFMALPVGVYCLAGFARTSGPLAGEWLALFLGVLWTISPLVIGYCLSKDFHTWRARRRGTGRRSA